MSAFDRIAGYEKEKEELKSLVEIFNNRKKYELKGASLPKGIIFYGDAGTGKTLFSEVLAEECSLQQIRIDLSESASENNIGRQIRKAFIKGAKSKYPTMIFFDELDKILPNEEEEYYTDASKSILAQLLTLIDGMDSINNIVFVATCNNYYALPASITRAGRFDKKIGLGMPNLNSRIAILHMYMDNTPAKFDMNAESIAKLTGGFSCAALKTVVNECLLRSDENNFVSEALIREKITEIKEEDLPTERSEQSYTIDATRNAGAFIVSRAYSNSAYVLTLEDRRVSNVFLDNLISLTDYDSDDDDDYYDDNCHDEEQTVKGIYSKKDYLAAISALLGGYVAEEISFNKVYDNVNPNLRSCHILLQRMSESGLLGLDLYRTDYYHYSVFDYPESYREKLHAALGKIMHECYDNAKAVIEKNKALLSRVSAELIKRKSIERAECEEIISECGGIQA